MKLIISTVVVGIVLFLLGWLFYGVLLVEYLKPYYGFLWRSETDMKIWAYALSSIVQAFMLYLIYTKGYKGGAPIAEGIRFGIYMSIFWGLPFALGFWAGVKVSYKAVAVDAIVGMAMMFIACILTAVIHGKTQKTA
jgi:hypothetical protein